jgi:hypothetical protein
MDNPASCRLVERRINTDSRSIESEMRSAIGPLLSFVCDRSRVRRSVRRGRWYPAGAISGATSSAGLGSARASAHPELTRRVCLSGVSAANAASSAARPQAEQVSPDTNSPVDCLCLANGRSHRTGAACKASAVGAKRRPPQHEPPAGAACRAAPNVARIADVPRSAKGRLQPPNLIQLNANSYQSTKKSGMNCFVPGVTL